MGKHFRQTDLFIGLGFEQVTLPFFVLHGEADTVTDPEVSRALFERASSKDKTIKLYPGMWHGLTSGETDENIEIVFGDIIAWLDRHINDAVGFDALEPLQIDLNRSLQRFTTAASPAKAKKQRLKQGSYLCGLKGRYLLHHLSAL